MPQGRMRASPKVLAKRYTCLIWIYSRNSRSSNGAGMAPACLTNSARETGGRSAGGAAGFGHRDFGPYPRTGATGTMGLQPKGQHGRKVGASWIGGARKGNLRDSG